MDPIDIDKGLNFRPKHEDEDIYRIPSDDYGSILADAMETEDIPYCPVQSVSVSDVRTSDCCSICLLNKADHVFISCSHLCCYGDCILELRSKRCPICNVEYMKVI